MAVPTPGVAHLALVRAHLLPAMSKADLIRPRLPVTRTKVGTSQVWGDYDGRMLETAGLRIIEMVSTLKQRVGL